jgi:hypothetical protein
MRVTFLEIKKRTPQYKALKKLFRYVKIAFLVLYTEGSSKFFKSSFLQKTDGHVQNKYSFLYLFL